VARHRGAATSSALGAFTRGVLFERNALRVFHCCADAECRAAFGPAVYLTYLHRLVAFAEADPERARWVTDPFTAAPSGWRQRWWRRLETTGRSPLPGALARLLLGRSAGSPRLDDGHAHACGRAWFLPACRPPSGGVASSSGGARSDRSLVFSEAVVPTYLATSAGLPRRFRGHRRRAGGRVC
jgi:hypothetical protein